jgi:hypothetical protein
MGDMRARMEKFCPFFSVRLFSRECPEHEVETFSKKDALFSPVTSPDNFRLWQGLKE